VRSRPQDRFNTIDPNLSVDRDGNCWLAWGSFWDGIKLARIDAATGKRPKGDAAVYSLARRTVARNGTTAVEAAYILRRGEWYYLFVSFDQCCRGAASTYFIACGRSREITGPYVDADGRAMLDGGGSRVLDTNARFRGAGHNSVLRDGSRDLLVYHAYDAARDGVPTLRISPLEWTAQGWPRALP